MITVSNGDQFRHVTAEELPQAIDDGFYQPAEFGLTIVGNGDYQFEVPITDVEAAKSSGLDDWLANERGQDPQAGRMHDGQALHVNQLGTESPAAISVHPSADTDDQQREQQAMLASATGISRYWLIVRQWIATRSWLNCHQWGSHSISIMIHAAIFLLLASLVLVDTSQEKSVLIASATAPRDAIQEVVIETESLEITDPNEVTPEDLMTESESIEEITPNDSVEMDFLANVSGAAAKPPAVESQKANEAKMPTKKASAVFGTQKTANDYIFVIDNSNSMTNGRFETALNELMIAVNGLNRRQRFYVIFYSDTAYAMMYPNPVTQLVVATDENKKQLYRWLTTVPLCLKTNGKEAIQAALNMKPDVIYVLGDGSFTDGASRYFAKQPRTKTILHTRGMQVSGKTAKDFEALAVSHGGTYKDVGVAPAAAALAKRYPRPRNKKRNGVWGLTLPAK